MILGVAGFQNSGKTTLVEILIPIITRAGFRVATVKHVAHDDLQIDAAGTDTHRHKKAGARLAVAVSDSESVYFHGQPQALEEILARVRTLEAPDLILVEGFKGSSIPKIVVGAAPYSGEPLYHWDGSKEDALRIAEQIVAELRKDRPEIPKMKAELESRRTAIDETLRRLAERERRINQDAEKITNSVRASDDRRKEQARSAKKRQRLR